MHVPKHPLVQFVAHPVAQLAKQLLSHPDEQPAPHPVLQAPEQEEHPVQDPEQPEHPLHAPVALPLQLPVHVVLQPSHPPLQAPVKNNPAE